MMVNENLKVTIRETFTMNFSSKKKTFAVQGLAFAVASIMLTPAFAQTVDQKELAQLRAEVAELKALMQQQQQVQAQQQQIQQQQQAQIAQATETAKNVKKSGFLSAKDAEVNFYGFVRGDANYIIDGADDDFNKVNTVGGSTKSVKDKLRATAKTTRFGFDFNTLVNGYKVGGKIEADFAGDKETVRLRQAYVTYDNWLFGQTTSTFLSNHAPEMIDFNTNVGGGTKRLPMVRYAHSFSPDTKLFVALEESETAGATVNRITPTTKSSLPVLTAKLTQNIGDNANASVRAFVENYKVEAASIDNSKSKTAWGAAAGVTYAPIKELQLKADASYVKGNKDYLYGSNDAYRVVNGDVAQNEFTAVEVGATYKITEKLRTTLAYGALFADTGTDFAKASLNDINQNKRVQQAWINLIYSPVKPLDLGIEYINGQRKTFDNQKFDDDRVGFMAKYSF